VEAGVTEALEPQDHMDRLRPTFAYRLGRLVQACEDHGYEVRLVEGYRTQQRQSYLYSIGRTVDRHKPVVTDTLRSKHSVGEAMDICERRRGYSDAGFFRFVAEAAKRYGLKTLPWDKGHVELG